MATDQATKLHSSWPWMMLMSRILTNIVILIVIATPSLAAKPSKSFAAKPSKLKVELKNVVGYVKQKLGKDPKVSVGVFVASGVIKAQQGHNIADTLRDLIKNDPDIALASNSSHVISGRYFYIPYGEHSNRNPAIRIKFNVETANGIDIDNFDLTIHDFETVKDSILGTGRFPITPDDEKRGKALEQAILDPLPVYEGNKIFAGKGKRTYALEILAGIDSVASKTPTVVNDHVFVPLQAGEIYAVRIHNFTDYDAAVELRIDGINCFRFQSDSPKYKRWIIRKNSSSVVRGWYINRREEGNVDMRRFLVGKYTDEPPPELIQFTSIGKIGTISAHFHAAWTTKEGPPRDEAHTAPGLFTRNDGPIVRQAIRSVQRTVGAHRETITVRYNR